MPPTAAIKAARTPIPVNAAVAPAPTNDSTTRTPVIVPNNKDRAFAVSIDGATFSPFITAKMVANSATTNPINAKDPIADNDTLPALLTINMDADKDNINSDSDCADANIEPESIADSRYNIAPKAVIATVITIILLYDSDIKFDAANTTANMANTVEIATVAFFKLSGSIIASTPKPATKIPIATVSVIRLSLHVDANLVDAMIPATTSPNTLTAFNPLSKPLGSTKLNTAITPASNPIDIAINNILAPAFVAFFPANLVAAINAVKAPTITIRLPIVLVVIFN